MNRTINLVPCVASPARFIPLVAGKSGLKNPVSVAEFAAAMGCGMGSEGGVADRGRVRRIHTALFESNDIEGAVRESERLVKDCPTNVDGLYNLGAIHANLNHFDLAKDFWKRAIAANPASDSGERAQDGLAKISQAAAPGHGTSPHGNAAKPGADSRGDALLQDMLSKR